MLTMYMTGNIEIIFVRRKKPNNNTRQYQKLIL